MHTPLPQPLLALCCATLLLCACGDSDQTTARTPAFEENNDPFGICRMLTADDVSSVLPGHDGGMVAHSGGSLIEGVDAYQCSYTASNGSDFSLLTVIVNVASTDELYTKIKPGNWLHQNDQPIEVGDGGWVYSRADDEVKVKVKKGRALLDLELMAPAAQAHSPRMVELARTVAAQL